MQTHDTVTEPKGYDNWAKLLLSRRRSAQCTVPAAGGSAAAALMEHTFVYQLIVLNTNVRVWLSTAERDALWSE